ncbi:MAG: TIR domain-containing protein [Verrucomicrobiae bacterium]|nr:TIR domain-containing protein [Verrucomicrobiae bacterium]
MNPEPDLSPEDATFAGVYRYWAFISYSHQDNLATRGDGSGDHIAWANWLHEQLETFVVPEGYRDRPARTGEPMPDRFFPTFRDEAELPTSHDLGGQIRDALAHSRFLIVIASPRSARSRYVNEEVRYFRELGRGDRILVLIVDGEPNVRLHPRAGWAPEDDCFCPALVHPLRADGTVDDSQLLREEPIAADVRVKDSEPAREMRAKESTQDERRGLLDFMKLKLVAGLMGVGLDELVQRDKRRAEEQEKRARQALSRTEFQFARQLLDLAERETGAARWEQRAKAHARLAKSRKSDPQNRAAAILGLEEIRRVANRGAIRTFPVGPSVTGAVFSPGGSSVLIWAGNQARLWNAASGQPFADPLRHEDAVTSAIFSPEGGRILTASLDNTARLWDATSGRPLADPLRHEDAVTSAVFSPEGGRILTASGFWGNLGIARLWDAATGELLAESSSCLNCLLETAGGRRLNERELLEPIPDNEVAALRANFDTASDFDRLLRWWWSDPFTRPIHPSSAITVPLFVRRRIGELLDWPVEDVRPRVLRDARALRDARDAFPHHPLVSLCDALAEPAIAPDPRWLRQYAVSRLLAEPHYLVPMEPPNAIGDAKANRQHELTHGLAMDCHLGARLLLNDRPGEKRSTARERIAQARQLLARARKLSPENLDIRKLANELGVAD